MASTYRTNIGDLAQDKAQVLKLWQMGLGENRRHSAEQKYDHMYLNNPSGVGRLYLLNDTQQEAAIGVQCLVARQFFRNNKHIRSGLMADFVVDPAHRTLGPAVKLLETVVKDGTRQADFVYGYPNKNSEPVIKRAGYQLLGNAVRFARPILTPDFALQHVPGWMAPITRLFGDLLLKLLGFLSYLPVRHQSKWKLGGVFDEEVDHLWNTADKRNITLSKRDHTQLQWRYNFAENSGWQIFTAHNKLDQTLKGYIIWRNDAGMAIISDFFARDREKSLSDLFKAFSWHIVRRTDCRSISVEFFGCPSVSEALKRAGYEPREEEPIYCIQSELQDELSPWYLTAFDRDS